MSKYTTEVRFICETASGLTESKGYNDVADIIQSARPHIFNFDYPIFDESYRGVLETKILKHYYTREIGLETVGLWKLKLDAKMNEIMPYYNKLYETELITFNPLYTTNIVRTHSSDQRDSANKTIGDAETTSGRVQGTNNTSSNGTNNTSTTASGNVLNAYSDTPQGALTDLVNNAYLTNATKSETSNTEGVMNTTTDQVANTTDETTTGSKTRNTNETNQYTSLIDYTENVSGWEGRSASTELMRFRETLLNIDMQVINDLEPLFMQVW